MTQLMSAVQKQNEILEQQTEQLRQICAFITPVSAFFAAMKNFVVIMAWIVGFIAAGIALWQLFVAWIKAH